MVSLIQLTQLDASRAESSHQSPVPAARRKTVHLSRPQRASKTTAASFLVRSTIRRSNSACCRMTRMPCSPSMRRITDICFSFAIARCSPSGSIRLAARSPAMPSWWCDRSCQERVVATRRSARRPARSSSRRWIAPHNRLLWVDRRGTPQGVIGPERVDYDYIALSPDTRHAAVALRDWISGRRDLWLVDTERSVPDQFTVTSPEAGFPIWAPDGAGII